MRQILHIFKKDVRHRWVEILISLVLLLVLLLSYLKTSPEAGRNGIVFSARSLPWYMLSGESIHFWLIFVWIFLIVRVVQSETLVGDRQWWVTKPYDWWKLLLAKVLIWVCFVGIPLFLVQLFLLHRAQFPVLSNIGGVLNMQLGLAIFLLLPSLALGSVTQNLGQALIGVVVALIAVVGMVSLLQKVPSYSMQSAAETTSVIQGLIVLCSLIGTVGWQFARRRTWASRGVLFGAVAAIGFLGLATPYGKYVEKKYPLVEASESPARIQAGALRSSAKKRGMRAAPNWLREVYLQIPFEVSGIAPGKIVRLDGINAVIETPEGHRLDPGWRAQWTALWPEGGRHESLYELKRKEYEALRAEPVRLHIQLALTEYDETEARELVVLEDRFSDSDLGFCELAQSPSRIECRRPFRYPALAVTFDPSQANCEAEPEAEATPEDRISHVWYPPATDEGPQPGLNPVVEYQLFFSSSQPRVTVSENSKRRSVYLCAGAKMKMARLEEKRHVRVKLEIESVRLSDLVQTWPGWE